MGELRRLVGKEIRDILRDPHIVVSVMIMPLLIFLVMGQVASWGTQQVSRSAAPSNLRLGIVPLDEGRYEALLEAYLANRTRLLTRLERGAARDPVGVMVSMGLDAVIVVPPGFSHNISRGLPGEVVVYSVVKELGIASTAKLSSVNSLVQSYMSVIQAEIAARHGLDPSMLEHPVVPVFKAWVGSTYISLGRLNMLAGMMFAFAFTPMIAIGLAAQMAAMSMGVEKEEKTLETLLSLPLSRRSIAVAKLLGSLVVGALATASYVAGFAYYMYSVIPAGSSAGMGGIAGIYLTPTRVALLVVSFLLAVLLANTMAALLGGLGSNVRSSQSLASIVWMMLFAIGFGLLYVSLSSLSPLGRAAIALTPLSPPYLVAKDIGGTYAGLIALSLAMHVVYIAMLLEALTRLIGSEILLSNKSLAAMLKDALHSRFARRCETAEGV